MPGVSSDLSAICLKCLAKHPQDRYLTAHELNADLTRFLNGEVTFARPASTITRVVRWTKRNPIPATLLAVVAFSAIIVSFLLVRSENLRQLSESRERQVIQSSRQLHQAVDKLFLTVASTPELKLKDFEIFRQKMLSEASALVSQFVSEKPDDLVLFELYADTQLSFVKLSHVLGEGDVARQRLPPNKLVGNRKSLKS
jgi:preprotein translocase subunit SecE